MRIAILGAGGVGGYYGGLLARAGHAVTMLARGENLRALRERGGPLIRTPDDEFMVAAGTTDAVAGLDGAELALVTVKSYALDEIAPAASRLAAGGATIVPLLNGVDATARLASQSVPARRLLAGLTYVSAARVAPGEFERRSPFQRVIVGDPANERSEQAERVAAAFAGAGVEARAADAIDVELWRKFTFLAALSAACGLARRPIGPVRDTALGETLLERAVGEIAAVARARGVDLPADEERRTLELIRSLPDGMKPSFLLDLERGGPTELDILSGTVSRLGRDAGVPTPVHDTATAALGAPAG